MEREMIRERIKLGLARRKKQGLAVGRQKGSKDKSKRKRLGYFQRERDNQKSKFKQTTPPKTGITTPLSEELNQTPNKE